MKEACLQVVRIACCVVCLLISTTIKVAAEGDYVPKDSAQIENFSIYYQCDSISIDTTYLSNKRQIQKIKHYLIHSPRIDSITIYAWASPEGGYNHNKWLSRERAKTPTLARLRCR